MPITRPLWGRDERLGRGGVDQPPERKRDERRSCCVFAPGGRINGAEADVDWSASSNRARGVVEGPGGGDRVDRAGRRSITAEPHSGRRRGWPSGALPSRHGYAPGHPGHYPPVTVSGDSERVPCPRGRRPERAGGRERDGAPPGKG